MDENEQNKRAEHKRKETHTPNRRFSRESIFLLISASDDTVNCKRQYNEKVCTFCLVCNSYSRVVCLKLNDFRRSVNVL